MKRRPHHRKKGPGNAEPSPKRKQKNFSSYEKKVKKYGAVHALYEEEMEELEEQSGEDRYSSK